MLGDFFNGMGLVVLFLIALAIAVIIIGFKVLLWVVGIVLACVLGYAVIKASWYWICRFFAWILPPGTSSHRWFKEQYKKIE